MSEITGAMKNVLILIQNHFKSQRKNDSVTQYFHLGFSTNDVFNCWFHNPENKMDGSDSLKQSKVWLKIAIHVAKQKYIRCSPQVAGLLLRYSPDVWKPLTALFFCQPVSLSASGKTFITFSPLTIHSSLIYAAGLVRLWHIQPQIDVMARWEAQTGKHLGHCPKDLSFSHQTEALSLFRSQQENNKPRNISDL